jgi:hypothetical protein
MVVWRSSRSLYGLVSPSPSLGHLQPWSGIKLVTHCSFSKFILYFSCLYSHLSCSSTYCREDQATLVSNITPYLSAYVELGVHNLDTTGQAKDECKKSFEVSSAQEKVKEAKVPKAKCEEKALQSQGWLSWEELSCIKDHYLRTWLTNNEVIPMVMWCKS